tara:strand:+ start:363 stop:1157 length:795 start_codon:yes stop_codon:yes gene_type:complete
MSGLGVGLFQWGVGNANASICWNETPQAEQGYAVQLFGNGAGIACGVELDVFLSPTTPNYSTTIDAHGLELGIVQDAPSLAAHSSLIFSFEAELSYQSVNINCSAANANPPCGTSENVDYGGIMASLIAENQATNQILFYQIYLYDTRQTAGCGDIPCEATTVWFDQGSESMAAPWYGVSHLIANYGSPCLSQGTPHYYSLDVLPYLEQVINDGPSSLTPGYPALDTNLNNWRVTQMYLGTALVGDVQLRSIFSKIDLVGHGSW